MKTNQHAPSDAQAALIEILDNVIDKYRVDTDSPSLRPFADWVEQEMRLRARQNVEIGGHYVESPLEWKGFAYLLGVLTDDHPLAVRVHPPNYGPDAVDRWEEERVNTITRWQEASPERASGHGATLRAALTSEGQSPEALRRFLEYLPGLPPTVHLVMQYTFSELRVGDKTVRPDVLLLVPECGVRYVFEFDGYNYHSSEEAFAHDRRRDRALDDIGYRVRRFPFRDLSSAAAREDFATEFSAFLDKKREGWKQRKITTP